MLWKEVRLLLGISGGGFGWFRGESGGRVSAVIACYIVQNSCQCKVDCGTSSIQKTSLDADSALVLLA